MTLDPQDLSQAFIAPDQGDPPVSADATASPLEAWDYKARLAIEGVGPSAIADKLELYEKHYDQWLEAFRERNTVGLDLAHEMSESALTDGVGWALCRVFPKTIHNLL